MRSRAVYLILLIAVATSIFSLTFYLLDNNGSGRARMMGAMVPQSFWLVLFLGPLILAVFVVGYVLVFPELNLETPRQLPDSAPRAEQGESALSAVLRVLNEDERKVIEILVSDGGVMQQKDIRWKTGLSRVKTHRVLFRLAQRGMVTAEKHYNTNKITLADWLTRDDKS